jgi:hypothetical protein
MYQIIPIIKTLEQNGKYKSCQFDLNNKAKMYWDIGRSFRMSTKPEHA